MKPLQGAHSAFAGLGPRLAGRQRPRLGHPRCPGRLALGRGTCGAAAQELSQQLGSAFATPTGGLEAAKGMINHDKPRIMCRDRVGWPQGSSRIIVFYDVLKVYVLMRCSGPGWRQGRGHLTPLPSPPGSDAQEAPGDVQR